MDRAEGYLEFGDRWKLDPITAEELENWTMLDHNDEDVPGGECNWRVGHLVFKKKGAKPEVKPGYKPSNPVLYLDNNGHLNDKETEEDWLRLIIKKFMRPNGFDLWGRIVFDSDDDMIVDGNNIETQGMLF